MEAEVRIRELVRAIEAMRVNGNLSRTRRDEEIAKAEQEIREIKRASGPREISGVMKV